MLAIAGRHLVQSQGYIDPNFPNPGTDGDASIIIYGYTPSLGLGVVGTVYFGLATLAAIALLIRIRWDAAVFLLGFASAMETVGYIMRIQSTTVSPYRVSFFVVQYFMIVVAPVFIAAAIYLILSRLIILSDRRVSPLSPRGVMAVFLSFDIVTITIQVVGAALIGVRESNQQDPTTANNALIAGLAIQSASFAVFCVILLVCMWRIVRWDHITMAQGKSRSRVTLLFALLLVAAALVELRTAFRLAESAEGVYGHLSTHEVFFGTLEFLPIVLAIVPLLYLAFSTRKSELPPVSLTASSGEGGRAGGQPARGGDGEALQKPRAPPV